MGALRFSREVREGVVAETLEMLHEGRTRS